MSRRSRFFFKSRRRYPGALSRERSFGCASDFLRLTGRYAPVSSQWAQNGVGRQPASKRLRSGEKSPGANVG
jgi:hypothetical protein